MALTNLKRLNVFKLLECAVVRFSSAEVFIVFLGLEEEYAAMHELQLIKIFPWQTLLQKTCE